MVVKVQGEPDPLSLQQNVFREFQIQQSLQAQCNNILNARAYSTRPRDTAPQHLGYLYMDWAPYGSLSDLINSTNSDTGPE